MRTKSEERSLKFLLYVFGPFYEPYAAHDMVSILDAEDFPDFFGYSDSSARYYFSEEGNVFFFNLDRQLLASGKWLRTR
jgi:hypothetical protein